jgi:hypothetical protein
MSLSRCSIAFLLIVAREPFAQTAPPPRAHHAVVYDDRARRVIVSGGSTSPDGSRFITYDDLWSWDGARWEKMPVVGPARSSHRVAYDPDNARLLMIGGYDGRRYFGETLSLTSGAWTLLHDDTALCEGNPALRTTPSANAWSCLADRPDQEKRWEIPGSMTAANGHAWRQPDPDHCRRWPWSTTKREV